MELVVKIIKMRYNTDDNETMDILERSEKLRGYSTLLAYVRQCRSEGWDLKKSIDRAVNRCIKEGILRDFLEKNSPEVGSMLFKEITSEEFAEIRAEEAAKEFYEKGKASGLIETCLELGLSREDTAARLEDKLSLSKEAAEEYMMNYWKCVKDAVK